MNTIYKTGFCLSLLLSIFTSYALETVQPGQMAGLFIQSLLDVKTGDSNYAYVTDAAKSAQNFAAYVWNYQPHGAPAMNEADAKALFAQLEQSLAGIIALKEEHDKLEKRIRKIKSCVIND